MASSSTSSSASLPYQPIYTPSTSSYNPSINPVHSTHAAHFRRLYDIYRLLLQRGDLERAKRAYALVVRCREFDWAMNWRDGIAMVTLPRSQQEEDGAEEGEAERLRREEELKARYLREALAVHSRGVTSFRHVREPVTILRELILHLIVMHNYNEALQEVELCANMPPFREDPSLYYYGGLVCVYLAQEEMERMRSQGAGSTQSQTQATQSGHGTSQAQRTRRGSSSGSSSSSASTSSSSSSSSTSSDEEDQTGEGNRPGGRGKGKQRRQHTQPARVFCKPVSTETMQTLERESVHWTMEARRWFEKAIEAAEEGQRAAVAAEEDGVPQWRTGVAREVDEAKRWLDLVRIWPSPRCSWLKTPRTLPAKRPTRWLSPLIACSCTAAKCRMAMMTNTTMNDDMKRWTARYNTSACRLTYPRQASRMQIKVAVLPHVLALLPAMCLSLPLLLDQTGQPRRWTKKTSMSLIPAPIVKARKRPCAMLSLVCGSLGDQLRMMTTKRCREGCNRATRCSLQGK